MHDVGMAGKIEQGRVKNGRKSYVTMTIAGQLFGMSIMQVEDIVEPNDITAVPLASKHVAGVMNLRGRVVTVIDLKQCLCANDTESQQLVLEGNRNKPEVHTDQPQTTIPIQQYSITVEKNKSYYSFLVDNIGDVRVLPDSDLEQVPSNLDPQLRNVASGIYQLKDELLIILDVDKVFECLFDTL